MGNFTNQTNTRNTAKRTHEFMTIYLALLIRRKIEFIVFRKVMRSQMPITN